MPLEHRPAYWTHEKAARVGHLYYFVPIERASGPYRRQIEVRAIVDIADDGTLAGVELIDHMPPPPAGMPVVPAPERANHCRSCGKSIPVGRRFCDDMPCYPQRIAAGESVAGIDVPSGSFPPPLSASGTSPGLSSKSEKDGPVAGMETTWSERNSFINDPGHHPDGYAMRLHRDIDRQSAEIARLTAERHINKEGGGDAT